MSSLITKGAFTLFEVMVTMVIAIVLASSGYMMITGVLPRQRLSQSGQILELIIKRGQNEAYTRATRVGVEIKQVSLNQTVAEVFVDDGATEFVRDAGENLIATATLKSDVAIVDAVCNPFQLTKNCGGSPCNTVFFNGAGQAIEEITNATKDYEIFIVSSTMAAGQNGREVEALSTGFVQLVALGQSGSASGGTTANTDCP